MFTTIHQSWRRLLTLLSIGVLTAPSAQAEVQIGIVNSNGQQPTVRVESNGPDKRLYDSSQSANSSWQLRVRGRCPNKHGIDNAMIVLPGGGVLSLDGGSGNRFLTGNNGTEWETHLAPGVVSANNPALIQACNQRAQQQIQQNPANQAQILNSNFEVRAHPGLKARASLHCSRNTVVLFSDIITYSDEVNLPIDALCAATGFVQPQPEVPALVSKAVTEVMETQDSSMQSCRIRVGAGLTATRADLPIKFRFQHGRFRPATNNYHYDTGPVRTVTTGPQPSAFMTETIDVPAVDGREKGKIRIKVISPNALNGPWADYEMDCPTTNNTLQTNLPPSLKMGFKVTKTKMVSNQICPSEIEVWGNVLGRGDYAGNVLFVGDQYLSSLLPYDVTNGQTVRVTHRRPITWASQAGTQLQIAGGSPSSPTLRKQTIRLGMRATNSSNEVFASLPQKNHTLKCALPQAQPLAPSGIGVTAETPISTPAPPATFNSTPGLVPGTIPGAVPGAAPATVPATNQAFTGTRGGIIVKDLRVQPGKGRGPTCQSAATFTLVNQTNKAQAVTLASSSNGKSAAKPRVVRLKPGQQRRMKSVLKLPKGRNNIVIAPTVKGMNSSQLTPASLEVTTSCPRK